MPAVFVSPSLQEYNPYVDGGNEEYYMNPVSYTHLRAHETS